jgi:hypothetical protein
LTYLIKSSVFDLIVDNMRISSRFPSIKIKLILIWIFGFALVLPLNSNAIEVNAQTTPSPGGNATIEIISHQDGQEVPVGELTIEGISSDDEESNCQVYADVNDITPLQNATAAGVNGGDDDYSQWTFAYIEDYQLITEGANELTAKISCFDGDSPIPMSEWHSINVTGVTGGPATSDEPTSDEPTSDEPTSDEPTSDEPTSDEGTTSTGEEAASDANEGEENDDLGDILPGVPPVG